VPHPERGKAHEVAKEFSSSLAYRGASAYPEGPASHQALCVHSRERTMTTQRSWKMLLLSITAGLSVVVLAQPAGGIQLAYEGFRPSFPVYASGGAGFTGAWSGGSGYTTRAKSLCFPKLKASEGGSIAGESGSLSRTLAQSLGTSGTTRYISFLIQPLSDLAGFSFFGLLVNGLFIGKPGAGAIDQFVIEDAGGANQVASASPVVVWRTALLVVKINFNAGPDVVTLYVDPIPGHPEPSGKTVKQNLDLGTVSSISIVSFGAVAGFDEIRIGTTYADVVPSGDNHPDPDSLGCL
jgi:hypothetical protein